MLHRLIPTAAMLAAALAPAGALAQEVRNSSVPIYELTQVSINASAIAPGAFEAKTQSIRSCRDARQLAKDIGARVTRDSFVRATSLPSELQPVLAETPTGRATPVMVEQGAALHVFVVCGRS